MQSQPHCVGVFHDTRHGQVPRIDGTGLGIGFQCGMPVRVVDVGGPDFHAMLTRVADKLGRRVKAHGLGIQHGSAEGVRVMAFQPAGDIDQEGKACCMAFGKAVVAEPLDLAEAVLGKIPLIAVGDHALDHLALEIADRADPPEGRHGATQFIGFAGGEFGGDDGNVHRLLLKQRHAERLLEHLLQFRLGVGDLFDALAALQIGMHHLALDRTRANDRHLDHQIIVIAWLEARQHRHLRPAFDLEHAERICPADHVIGRLVILLDRRQGFRLSVMGFKQRKGLAQAGQHAERQHIDLEHVEAFQIVLVPFDDGAVFHCRILDRDE